MSEHDDMQLIKRMRMLIDANNRSNEEHRKARDAAIRRRLNAGATQVDCAAAAGISEAAVRKIVAKSPVRS